MHAITLHNLSKTYKIYPRPIDRLKQSFTGSRRHYFTEFEALKPLSLTISKGQTVGIIGENGSGKSTLLQLITQTLTPSSGTLEVHGRVSALLELGAGFNPEFSGHDNIYLNGSILGLSRADIAQCYDDIVAFSGLDKAVLSQPVSTYSSGMYVRLAFAVAIAVQPDILIVDEALAVGDEGFQRKCFARIKALQEAGATILFVSHAARTIIDLCDHAILLDKGECLGQGSPAQIVADYHKMLFAQPQDKPAIRASLVAKYQGQTEQISIAETGVSHPETRSEYNAKGARIYDVALHTLDNEPVQCLHQGQHYRLSYKVICEKPLSHLRCAMTIKTMTGIELAATVYHGVENELHHLQAGQTLNVYFTFPCSLTKGDYFINVGLVQEHFGTIEFIHRIVDVLHIKVMPREGVREGNIEPLGLMDIGAECSVMHTV